jgi:hypothetical protein
MQTQTGDAWRNLFENWPQSIPRQGMLVTNFQETIPFVNYMISGGILLIERDKPDTTGARKVMITYESISAVKIAAPIELARFQVMGFQAP